MRRIVTILCVAPLLSACNLQEIAIATADDVVIAEVVLRAGSTMQTAYLHRTASTIGGARVPDADIIVREVGTSRSFHFFPEADTVCLGRQRDTPHPRTGTCYIARAGVDMVRPGARYSLDIALGEGRSMRGITVVPGTFDVARPRQDACRIAPGQKIELSWTPSAGSAVYLVEGRFIGLRQALRAAGVPVTGNDAVILTGLSVTAADTALSFPDELGLFDRFDDEIHPILLALREGVPANVTTDVVVAATDHNYVNWVRGGAFNPSGFVRISSIEGDGRGVFGSLVLRELQIRTTNSLNVPACS